MELRDGARLAIGASFAASARGLVAALQMRREFDESGLVPFSELEEELQTRIRKDLDQLNELYKDWLDQIEAL